MFLLRQVTRVWRQASLWWRGRKWLFFLQALPALLAGAAIFVPTAGALLTPVQELEGRYLEQAKTAYKSKDYTGALTCYDRLAYLGTERPEVLYGLGLCADALGQASRAEPIMNALAPADQAGYAPAHFWEARRILSTPQASPGVREAAESHLLRALDGQLDDREAAHALLGEVYFEAGRYDEAELHLTKAVKAKPQLRLRLAQLYAVRGDKDRARAEAQLAVGYFRARSKADLDDRRARLGWADATAFLEDFPGAVAILREGLNVSDDPIYAAALGGVYFLWSEAVGRDANAKPGDQLVLVEAGLRCDPTNVGLLNRLLEAVKVGGPKADQARDSLQGLLASGKATASAHFALGLDAWQRGKAEEARVHFERANELAPQTPVIANNLAWVLAASEHPDLDRALDLSNLAVGQSQKDLSFRDTRGRIFMKLGRWKDALADLEAALPGNPDNTDLHSALAEVYDRLGAPETAAEHRRLAEKKPRDKAKAAP